MTPESKYADKSIEELFAALEQTASALESGEVPLEASFSMYEEGMEMLKEVTARIDLVEKKMIKVSGASGGAAAGAENDGPFPMP